MPVIRPAHGASEPSHPEEEPGEEELLQRNFDAGARERVPAEGLVQRYKIEREPTTKEVYSRSDDDKLVTGMSTPNHDLLVDNVTKIGRMNSAVSASPLDFFSAGTKDLFVQTYHQVNPPGYQKFADAIESITQAPLHIPIEVLRGDVSRFLANASRRWSGS